MLRLRNPLLCAVMLSFGSAQACMWDRDTLSHEAQAMPDVVQVATGRFERNPPLYYQVRIDRETADVKKHPENLDLYDDISVAYSRIGDDDRAIEWIERKRERMGDLSRARTVNGKRDAFSEAAYRYYANAGTFWIVRWMRHGANESDIQQARHSRNLIARAIEINPNAHFGREVVQLRLTDWLIDEHTQSLCDYLGGGIDSEVDSKADAEANMKGLIGLIVLGELWEFPDAFDALGGLLERHYHNINRLGYFVVERELELVSKGHKMRIESENEFTFRPPAFHDYKKIESEFARLRAEAELWQSERTAFMTSRLKAGRHPDTDPHFWDGYSPRPIPQIEYSYFEELDPEKLIIPMFLCCCSSPFLAFGMWIVVRRRRKRKLEASQ